VASQALLFLCGTLSLVASLATVFPGWLVVSFVLRVRDWPSAVSRLR
jgi:hypothetical protein